MGRYRSVSEGSNRVRHKMILSLVSSVLFASVALGAPGASNYGAAAVVGPAKQIASTPSIQCRTEYVTLWDTEYQEKEEQVCVTKYEKECTQRVQRLNAQPSTSRIVNLSGGVTATTRCGRPSREPARTFRTTSARMCKRPMPSRLLIRSATTCQSRSVSQFPSRSASRSPTRCAPTNPSQNARMCLAKLATQSTRGSLSE